MKNTINLNRVTPFEGSDETWKRHFGENWKDKKQEYLQFSKHKLEILKNKAIKKPRCG